MKGLPLLTLAGLAAMIGCRGAPPMPTVDHVDLERFMGDWYVVANIPTSIEEGAHNAVESYVLAEYGTIATTFTFRKGGFDGEQKTYTPTGYVRNAETNAEWGMQFLWPFRSDYRIVYLDDGYEVTVIGRNKRDHVWIMARRPEIAPRRYARILERVAELGYDTGKVQLVPQRWD